MRTLFPMWHTTYKHYRKVYWKIASAQSRILRATQRTRAKLFWTVTNMHRWHFVRSTLFSSALGLPCAPPPLVMIQSIYFHSRLASRCSRLAGETFRKLTEGKWFWASAMPVYGFFFLSESNNRLWHGCSPCNILSKIIVLILIVFLLFWLSVQNSFPMDLRGWKTTRGTDVRAFEAGKAGLKITRCFFFFFFFF